LHRHSPALWSVAPDGSAIVVVERTITPDASTAAYAVTKWDFEGRQLLRVTIPYAPRAIPSTIIDSLVTVYAEDGRARFGAHGAGGDLRRIVGDDSTSIGG
jgi:hypothetical protein